MPRLAGGPDMDGMAMNAVNALLAARQESTRLHRIVVRVGAVAAWLATAIYLAAGALSGNSALIYQAVGPFLAAVLMTVQMIIGKEHGGIALAGSGLVVVVWSAVYGVSGDVIPAGLALVVIASLGMMFVTWHRNVIAPTVAAAIFAIPFLWDIDRTNQIMVAVTMALSFVMTHFILSAIQRTAASIDTRYQMLFEEAPTAALEEDWSEAIEYVRSEYTGKPERIKQFLMAYPTVVRLAVSRARILRANEAALELLEVKNPERFIGFRDPDVINEHTLESFVNALVFLYEERRVFEQETSFRCDNGEIRWINCRAVDTSTEAPGARVLVAMADVTHMKERNEAMAQAVKAKDEFIANISHELRTPLTAIMGLTKAMVSDEQMGEPERDELLELVSGQASEMANIVEDLLVAARAEMGTVSIQPEEVDLVDELAETMDALGVQVEVDCVSVPRAIADPHRVRQILRNLLTNAERYGGPHRRVISGCEGSRVWLEVRDDGNGIPDDKVTDIFAPYVTAHQGVSGSVGLGLSVARQLTELMDGTLVYFRDGSESVFRVELPVAGDRTAVLASHGDPA